MQKLIIIAGPTAVGKTNLSINLAKKIHGEIISADSMQIYKDMDIGSAKVTEEEKDGITHHLIDIVNPDEDFTACDFKTLAENKINEITNKGKYPIIIGGTGLYLNSLIYQYDFSGANRDDEYRNYLSNIAKEKGNEFLHEMLKDIAKESYNKLHPNNLKRVIRALEIYKLTGKTLTQFDIEHPPKIPYDLKYFVLTMDREILYQRINQRVNLMMDKGLLEEVEKLRSRGFTKDMQSMKGIGYKEILSYLDGEISLDEAVEMIKKGSRNYAKRQLTWFRKEHNAIWINKDEFENESKILDYVVSLL